MQAKIEQRAKAIELRIQGFSYREILEIVPVAKSSLSLWLKSVKLAKSQKQRLTDKKLAGMKRGWESRHNKRVKITQDIKEQAKNDVGKLTERELWLIGTALYWGEGDKEKKHRPGSGVKFSNSDPKMIILFLRWLQEIVKEPKENIYCEIYLHESSKNREIEIKKFWENVTNLPSKFFTKIRWKRNKIKTNRINIHDDYFGLLRINVRSSSSLNRKISGWIEGINKHCGVV